MDYYYIVASLPRVGLGPEPPLTKEQFLRQCQGILSEKKIAEVESILEGRIECCESGYGCSLVSAEIQLRNAVARIRGSKSSADPRQYLREHSGFSSWVEKLATDAFGRGDPRERELALDHARWHIADELAGVDPFTFGHVLAFAVKLRIAIRWDRMDKKRGAEKVEEFIDDQTANEDRVANHK